MDGEPSKSLVVCQTDVWKTCVICGHLNQPTYMRSINKSSHLQVAVAYLKFTGSIDMSRDFSDYDDQKTYECYVCCEHMEAPAKAIRKVYAFPPDVPMAGGKWDPTRLLAVLKKHMPLTYHQMTLEELDDAIPDIRVPMMREVQKLDCSCYNVMEKARRRLKTVIENVDETETCIRLNFALFEELSSIQKDLNVNIIREGVKGMPLEISTPKQKAHERYLMGFEHRRRMMPSDKRFILFNERKAPSIVQPRLEMVPFQPPPLRHLSILPSFPGIPYPTSPLHHLFIASSTQKANNNNIYSSMASESSDHLKNRKRKNPLSPALIQLSTSEETSAKKSPSFLRDLNSSQPLLETDSNISQPQYSQSILQDQNSDYAKEIINTKLVVFSNLDLAAMFPQKNKNIIHHALASLESAGLIFSHATASGVTVYIKEIRRENIKELWNYGIIPEHYRQRLIGSSCTEPIHAQFDKYKEALLEMNCKEQLSELIGMILTSSNNSELQIEFGKFDSDSGDSNFFCKKRAPKLDTWNSDPHSTTS